MFKAIKVSLRYATHAKLRRVEAVKRAVRGLTQDFVDALWAVPGALDAATLNRVDGGGLSYRYRAHCLKVALETIGMTNKSARAVGTQAGKPRVRGAVRLGQGTATVERGRGSFDYVLKISGYVARRRIILPFKSHKRLEYWLAKPGARLVQGCLLGDGWAAVSVEVPDEEPREGRTLGVDIGIHKLLVDSDGVEYGLGMWDVCARVRRRKPGSRGRLRASRARKDYINRTAKQLPWGDIGTLAVENLNGLKTGKRGVKNVRKVIAPWTYRQVTSRLAQLAAENRVRLIAVEPYDTSRRCPICGTVAKENRRGAKFSCVHCQYAADADYVGALNVRNKALGDSGQPVVVQSPKRRKRQARGPGATTQCHDVCGTHT